MTTGAIRDAADREKPALSQAELMKRRNRMAIWLVLVMLCLSLVLVILGIYTTTRTESLSITGYTSGVILAFGSFLGVLGLCLEENRKQLLVAAIVFLSFGIIASFLCLVVDGVFIVFNVVSNVAAPRVSFNSTRSQGVPCQGLTESCTMKVRSGTCYCCDLYDCANGGYMNNYYEFVGVRSCGDVLSLYVLIWVLTSLNLVAFFLGILTTAVLGSIKDQRSSSVTLLSSHLSEGGCLSSPTAPLLMDNTNKGHQHLYPVSHIHTHTHTLVILFAHTLHSC
uniref:Si:dkey-283j8.1 n=1 Tax=Oncorhynchus mykiss TaxID=8022 RepID=A0A8C7U5V6_ONCMY